ncbi:MAG TPA: glucoamylase family protein [Planctomycetota bacterium]
MKNDNYRERLAVLTAQLSRRFTRRGAPEQPLRAELFGVEQLVRHAKVLAARHDLETAPHPDRLLPRLYENEVILNDVYQLISAAAQKAWTVAPAAEWLLDNFHLIREQIRLAQRHLPRTYSRQLPVLRSGPCAGLPRVYQIVLELISHLDGKIDRESLYSFIAAYQSIAPLHIGELWAIPIMLRLALIDNLRRVAVRIAASRSDCDSADHWADRMVETAESDPKRLIAVMAEWTGTEPELSSAYVAELARRLQGQAPALTLALTWIGERLEEQGLTIDRLVQLESQRQAADQVSIGNSIGSVRFLSLVTWADFVEQFSVIEQTLREDPAGIYAQTTFATRDRCRHVVENIARQSPLSEPQVARTCVQLAEAYARQDGTITAHVGHYLIGKGLPELERAAQMRVPLSVRLHRALSRPVLAWYVGSILLITALATWGVLNAYGPGSTLWGQVLPGILVALCVSQFAVNLVNVLATLLARPDMLPRMDYSEGIPDDQRTLVVVPSIICNRQCIDTLVEALEVRYLANRCPNLFFALLTDFPDAPHETMPEDHALLQAAQDAISELNQKHGSESTGPFLLLHRPRRWNPRQNAWMGRERKRGKLSDLNAVLRGADPGERFVLVAGDREGLREIQYVITLDSDTQLPRGSAWRLVGTMAHPLNRPRMDPRRGIVVDGYGILQPGVHIDLPSASRSWFARCYSGEPGVDPYTREVSDVYQDLFHQGSFIGKGIYNVDAFSRVIENRLPENLILSHDLLEGCHARSGLVSDIALYEKFPPEYCADATRRHRWIRGDWQIFPWLLPWVPQLGRWSRNPLSLLSRWKIFDNLRRSLVPIGLFILVALGWVVLGKAWLWSSIAAAVAMAPSVLSLLVQISHVPPEVPLRMHVRATLSASLRNFAQGILTLAFLPFEAFVSLDAIARTCGRMLFTRKRLLEWTPAAEIERHLKMTLSANLRRMWPAPLAAGFLGGAVWAWHSGEFPAAAPLLAGWLLSPIVAWRISRPLVRRPPRLSAAQLRFLRVLSRQTWSYFETFVGPEDHWLVPDNYQAAPRATIAHRTSPTNIGLSLLAGLSAWDFGYISARQLCERIAHTSSTLMSLKRFRGHFYNWYDTHSLQPLAPLYVSSVDSGNLTAFLLTLRIGLLDLPDRPCIHPRCFDGIADTLHAFVAAATRTAGGEPTRTLPKTTLHCIEKIEDELRSVPDTFSGCHAKLQLLLQLCEELGKALPPQTDDETRWWAAALDRQCREELGELKQLAGWLEHSNPVAEDQRHGLSPVIRALHQLERIPTLRQIARLNQQLTPLMEECLANGATVGEEKHRLCVLRQCVANASKHAGERIALIERLSLQCVELADIDYDFLLDDNRVLLAIGYNVSHRRRDDSYYDLLASEARLGSFVGIARGALPQEHWFAMGRPLTTSHRTPALLSWSGSMFEYLMPLLVMPTYQLTLLDQTYHAVVQRQIEYAAQRGVPWGISESAYNTFSAQGDYQYGGFGVPGLALKRGLSADLVVAPYATALALMVSPDEACANLEHMARLGFSGRYGFYEAIDYTPSRLAHGQTHAVISAFMAHHQGMSLLALAYLLLNQPMQRRFNTEPSFLAAEQLLHERAPKVAVHNPAILVRQEPSLETEASGPLIRVFTTPSTPIPEVHLLSNGRYNLMVTAAGGGYSRWKDLAVTRWREDTTRDNFGAFCYFHDVATRKTWSSGYQPSLQTGKSYQAVFSRARAEFHRRDDDFETHTAIAVSPEDDIELRRVSITNFSRVPRMIVLTSYAEIVLGSAALDASHPVYSNLFVQTELVPEHQAILAMRRPSSTQQQTPWMFHLMSIHGSAIGKTSYETDRMRFIGRGHTTANPQAMQMSLDGAPTAENAYHAFHLSDTAGSVLDPIVAIRNQVVVGPEETAVVDLVFGIGDSRDAALTLVEKYHDRRLADRVFSLAWTHRQIVLHQLNAQESDAQLYGRLASSIIYSNPVQRAAASALMQNRRGQSGLWSYGVSGDLPIVLLRIADHNKLDLAKQLVQAHAYWRSSGLVVDLVIWVEDEGGYQQTLHDQIVAVIAASTEAALVDRPGGIFVRRLDQLPEEDRTLFLAAARVVVTDSGGTLEDHVARRGRPEPRVPRLRTSPKQRETPPSAPPTAPTLILGNEHGGFAPDGREYVTLLPPGRHTPAPWVNVLANPIFGTVISESGAAYTWRENAHEFRLSPWYNDPVCDTSGEALYLRDEETGSFWSATPLPTPGATGYTSRHGFGYSVFEHVERGISSTLTIFVAREAPLKFTVLRLRNNSSSVRRVSATSCVEWVLGEQRAKSAPFVITEVDPQSGMLVARNTYNTDFAGRVAFLNCISTQHDAPASSRSVTGDRTEFLGRNGDYACPAAMARQHLSDRVGAGFDPCGALQHVLQLGPGEDLEIIFSLGCALDIDDAHTLLRRFRTTDSVHSELASVRKYWDAILGTVRIQTPDTALNTLANGWLLYQCLSSRIFGRSGFYQSGGAFGFRDQIQDSLALLHTAPQLVREHLLRCAGHQFVEGDVQHWWHPPTGRGTRTRCSDDYLWLPLATCHYLRATGDASILDQQAPFLTGRPVKPDEESYYDLPARASQTASLYDHCVQALKRSWVCGIHGMPLMGSCDWNDGMNLVGIHGRGESVWLAFFQHYILTQFAEVARAKGDVDFSSQCLSEAASLRESIEKHAWDGEWYLRAFYDDGTPLGSSKNSECQIDSIAQSWAVLSGAADPARCFTALDSAYKQLVRTSDGLILLFTPPFDKTPQEPGYIKGYLPGVRENGGQYTHASIWLIMAYAAIGQHERAWKLLQMINPIAHSLEAREATYRVEPYVIAADVYAATPHVGRGGWTWYTGSAGWTYQLIVGWLLGLQLEANRLKLTPRLPPDWPLVKVDYRYHSTMYHIEFQNLGPNIQRVLSDGVEQPEHSIALRDDGHEHTIQVLLK